MDSPKSVTHLSLCAGYGGIDLGLKRAIPNLRTVAFSEIEAFACANLVAKMEAGLLDAAPIWSDLKTFPWEEFCDRVGILSGGYPCQPFSSAGKRLGKDDPRHLWPFIADGISRMRPSLCFFENVEGHISLGLSTVISDLEELGYKVAWGIFSAAEVGAPHQRKRVFILAHRLGAGLERLGGDVHRERRQSEGKDRPTSAGCISPVWPSRPSQPQHGWEPPRVVGDAASGTRFWQTSRSAGHTPFANQDMGNRNSLDRSASPKGRQHDSEAGHAGWRQAEPALGRNFDGSAGGLDYAKLRVCCDNRTDELRLLGNGVVPATAERAFIILSEQIYL